MLSPASSLPSNFTPLTILSLDAIELETANVAKPATVTAVAVIAVTPLTDSRFFQLQFSALRISIAILL